MEIKDKIRIRRLQKNLTQKQLSDLTGISISSIEKYETGRRIPKREAMQKIDKVLGFSNIVIKQMLFYFSKLNRPGQDRVIRYAEKLSNVDKFKK